MWTGLALAFAGIPIGLWGATGFNLPVMFTGWAISIAGVVIFLTHIVPVP